MSSSIASSSSSSSSSSKKEKKISLKTSDGEVFEVEEPVAMQLEIVRSFFADNEDVTEQTVMPLPNVSTAAMHGILEYCRAHEEFRRRMPEAAPEEEVRAFEAGYVDRKSNEELKEMILAANYLNISKLLDFLTGVAAKRIENKSVEYVRAFFGVENDFTPEEEANLRREYEWAFEGVDED
ncbi:hypothetical protein ACOSP7_027761 [Xanthoceras sorbifolium]|uniref:SKP1-like protein n=1 Tax=Xanthoceras sorbifolium TaxID=99658 RepID=A0ABQ8HGV2_9ROSI|nr:hypothetical protein JRO89_XS11G0229000 [Xanthoceras sorbifolium]